METAAPDFDTLALQHPFTRDQWRAAWNAVTPSDLWPTVLVVVEKTGVDPLRAVEMLHSAMAPSKLTL